MADRVSLLIAKAEGYAASGVVPLVNGCYNALSAVLTDLPGWTSASPEPKMLRPCHVEIETISACNSACVMCPSAITARGKKVMGDALFHKIIDELAQWDKPPAVSLHGIGEPLLDKKLPERIRYAKDRRLQVSFVSNATLFTAETARRVVEAGVDALILSIETSDKVAYEQIRVGLTLEMVIAGVKALVAALDDARSAIPVTLLRVGDDGDYEGFDNYVRFWSPLLRPDRDWIRQLPRHNFASGFASTILAGTEECHKLFTTLNIRADGSVPLCCLDSEMAYDFGTVATASIDAIYNSAKFQAVRHAHLLGRRPDLALCGSCNHPEATHMRAFRIGASVQV